MIKPNPKRRNLYGAPRAKPVVPTPTPRWGEHPVPENQFIHGSNPWFSWYWDKGLAIVSILILGAVLRLYRIHDYLVFLGDEGRDVLVAKRILIDHQLTLLGPITSTGGMYLGPIYYYFITPFLWLFGYDPVGPAIMVALLGIATIYLIYRTGTDFFDEKTGLFASLLYATSPLVIIYSRSSWNPNILPFFSLLIIYSLLQVVINRRLNWLLIAGMAFGISLQLHYLSLLFLFVFGLVYLVWRHFFAIKYVFLFLLGLVSTFWPFILFELRHWFPISRTIWQFSTKTGSDGTFSFNNLLTNVNLILFRLFERLIVIDSSSLTKLLVVTLILFFVLKYFIWKNSRKSHYEACLILFIWLISALFAFGIYRGSIYDYYFAPVFALPFLLTGIFLSHLFRKGKKGKLGVLIILIILAFFHSKHSPHRVEPNRLLDQSERIARFVLEKTGGEPYNFALISKGNSDHAYRYFLELWGSSPVTIENEKNDPERNSVTDQLIIICEDKECQPLGNSLWEIAGFGQAEIVGVWDVFPVKVVRLVPFKLWGS